MSDEMDEMDEIISEFITEAEESLDKIEPMFVELEEKGSDKEMLDNIFRSVHTIKGAAGFLGFQALVDVAHNAENIMKKLRDNTIMLSKEIIDVILKSIDMLRLLLEHLKEKDGLEEDVSPLVKELANVLNAATSTETVEAATEPDSAMQETVEAVTEPDSAIQETVEAVTEPDSAIQETVEPVTEPDSAIAKAEELFSEELQTEEPSADIPDPVNLETEGPQAVEPPQNDIQDDIVQENIKPVQEPVNNNPNDTVAAAPQVKKAKETAQNLRVDVERIDKVMDLAGEVVLVRNRLLNISNSFSQKYSSDNQTETLLETVSFLDRVTSDMQLAVMRIRMQPIKKVLNKFPRLVRDMSASVKKDVELQIIGEGTEVDKTVIEHIGDPLTHILRNSIDHGLETTEERLASGKSEKGKIVISIFQKGNQVVIEISDDGKGINIDNLKAKGVEKGLFTREEADKMTDDAATDIIFMPGFTTKDVASELSGRGVGMDVVKTNISLLNGYVEVSTVKGVGTTFRICIPLTLAIIQALMVEVSGAKYAIPLSPIEETLKVHKDEIENITGQDVIVIRDKVCPLFELNEMLATGLYGDEENKKEHKYIVVIGLGEKKFCIAVDKLLGQEEVVIKTIDGIDTSSSYVLGATITGDGKVVFILDVTGISRNLVEISK